MINEELEEAYGNYNYDLGYYEGCRNILQMIHKNIMLTKLDKNLSERERVELLLKEVGDELDDAIESQKNSEKIFFDGY